MLTHHLASSPVWLPTYKSDSSVIDNSEHESNQVKGEDFDNHWVDNEPDARTSSITEASGLDSGSIKDQGIVFWAKNIRDSDSSQPTTPLHNRPLRPTEATSPQHHNQLHLPPPPTMFSSCTFQHHQRAQSEESNGSFIQVLQEIQTLERIANRLNDLYSLRDKLIRKGSRRTPRRL